MIFKKWNEVDEVCPCCNQVTKKSRGITRQNLKRIIRLKPTSTEWTLIIFFILFILIMLLYRYETTQCKEVVNNFEDMCVKYYSTIISNTSNEGDKYSFNLNLSDG